jgi:hypothetical protein
VKCSCECDEGSCECGEGSCDCCEEEAKKQGFFTKTWKYLVTGVTCAVVGVGVTLGANTEKVFDTLTKSEAKHVAIAAATYSAEQVFNKVKYVGTAESKSKAIKEVINEVSNSMPKFIEAAVAVKETVKDVKETVKDVKENVSKVKETKEVSKTVEETKK